MRRLTTAKGLWMRSKQTKEMVILPISIVSVVERQFSRRGLGAKPPEALGYLQNSQH